MSPKLGGYPLINFVADLFAAESRSRLLEKKNSCPHVQDHGASLCGYALTWIAVLLRLILSCRPAHLQHHDFCEPTARVTKMFNPERESVSQCLPSGRSSGSTRPPRDRFAVCTPPKNYMRKTHKPKASPTHSLAPRGTLHLPAPGQAGRRFGSSLCQSL